MGQNRVVPKSQSTYDQYQNILNIKGLGQNFLNFIKSSNSFEPIPQYYVKQIWRCLLTNLQPKKDRTNMVKLPTCHNDSFLTQRTHLAG